MTTSAAKPGRPRDPQADASILAAARDLMADGGLSGLTVEGTAAKAGVAKTTVYRRYPTKLDLAIAAVAELIHADDRPTGPESAADNAMEMFGETLGSSAAQAAMLAVAAAAATNPQVHERFSTFVIEPALRQAAERLKSYQDQGEASKDLNAEFYYDVLVGTLLHRLVIRRSPADQDFHDDFAKLMAFMLQGLPQD